MAELRRSVWDWSRCAEGFMNFSSEAVSNVEKKGKAVKRKSSESDFGHGNIFEKLAFGGEEDKAQVISWSSSDEEKEKEEKVVPVAKKSRRKVTPKASVPSRRSNRASTRIQRRTISDTVEAIHNVEMRHNTTRHDDNIIDIDEVVPSSHPSQDLSTKSDDATIQIFDSDSEDVKDGNTTAVTEKEEDDSEIMISDRESQQSPTTQTNTQTTGMTQANTQNTGMRGSDWLKSLQLKTPNKSYTVNDTLDTEDSGKKKKKHSKGGLADQLSKIQTRDKSAVRMWGHQLGKPSASQDSKSILLEVISFESLYSLQVVRCIHVDDKRLLSDTDHVDRVDDTSCHSNTNAIDSKLVLFPVSQADQLNLQIGSRVKIFPPWQQLELNDNQQILLCTKYCRLIEQNLRVSYQTPHTRRKTSSTQAKWKCPCVQGVCQSEMLCPAYQYPSLPGLIQETVKPTTSIEGKDSNSNLLKSSESHNIKHLQTISSSSSISPSHDAKSVSDRSLENTSICKSILKSIEACKENTNGVSELPSFTAHVHRIIQVKEKESSFYILLIEDRMGTVCKVIVSKILMLKYCSDINTCEGSSFIFMGLFVKERLVRENNEGLFSMLDTVWSGKCTVESQERDDTQDIQDNQDREVNRRGFCYILNCSDNFMIKQYDQTIISSPCTVFSDLRNISGDHLHRRISCVLKVLCVQSKKSYRILYVRCKDMRNVYGYYKIQTSCNDIIINNQYIVIRDLYIHKGCYYIDEYSHISTIDDTCNDSVVKEEMKYLTKDQFKIKQLWSSVNEGDLCFIKGKIYEVDEDSAYSWEECIYCTSDQLQSEPSKQLIQCINCKRTMKEGIQKLKMEVLVSTNLSNIQVKVDLEQSTIKNLLPDDKEDEDGYELSCVLYKYVGPLYCSVISTSQHSILLREITLLK
ncbi:hypothetical protein ACF0H5_006109 [Mactra antiquata]